MKSFLLFIFLLPTLLAAQSSENINVLHYDNFIAINDSNKNIIAQTDITLAVLEKSKFLSLDFKGMRIDSVVTGKSRLDFKRSAEKLSIPLNHFTSPGDTFFCKIYYSGSPIDGLIIKKNKYGFKSFFADNWPNRAHDWFPCNDRPDDKATVTFHITLPNHYSIVANGFRIEKTKNPDGSKTVVYDEKVLIPTYCMVFGAADFSVRKSKSVKGIPLSFWVYPRDTTDIPQEFGRAGQMVDYFTSRFGPFPYEKLALVQSSTIFGGMENASAIFFDEKNIGTNKSYETTVSHEIVHQWFGDYATEKEWSHLWLSEGFATYFGMQFFEYADGEAAFKSLLQKSREEYVKQTKWHTHAIVEKQPTDLMDLLNVNNYNKGAFVLHMLRNQVGDQNFWAGIKEYMHLYGSKNALTSDFENVMEAVSGDSLHWFFDQWVYKPGFPNLKIVWQWNQKSRKVMINVKQLQKSTKRFPFEIEFVLENQHILKTILINQSEQKFSLPLATRPLQVIADPDVKLLAEFSVIDQQE